MVEFLTRTHKRRIRRKKHICKNRLHHRMQQMQELLRSQPEWYRYKSDYDWLGGGGWFASEQTPFCRWHQMCHVIEVEYVRNPMDVNLMCHAFDGSWMNWME